jgi:hypothetical protein
MIQPLLTTVYFNALLANLNARQSLHHSSEDSISFSATSRTWRTEPVIVIQGHKSEHRVEFSQVTIYQLSSLQADDYGARRPPQEPRIQELQPRLIDDHGRSILYNFPR